MSENTATIETGSRETWLDVVKGFGIICVVAGHYTFPQARYLYWFHMPLFFAMSGYLFKPLKDKSVLSKWMAKRFYRLLVPYLAFVLFIFAAEYLRQPITDYHKLPSILAGLAVGGRFFPAEFIGIFGAFWFVTCLYFCQVGFAVLTMSGRSKAVVLSVLGLSYLLAHVEAVTNMRHPVFVPWNADVALIAVCYYSIGFFGRTVIRENRIPKPMYALAAAVSIALIALDSAGLFKYVLDLKYAIYTRPVLDIMVPIIFITAISWVGRAVADTRLGRFLSVLGGASLTIMYLHMWIIHIVRDFYQPKLIDFTLIGIFVPLAIWWGILNRFPSTRKIFLGSK